MDENQMDDTGRNNPLLNDLVLNTVFSFLNEKDIKSCRLVCLKWEEISRGCFVKFAKVFIKSTRNNGSEVLATFKEIFSDASLLPLTRFHFSGYFPEDKFEVIVNSLPTMTELFIDSLVLMNQNNYYISDWKIGNLKTLSCVGKHSTCTKIVIPLSKITSIQNLYLDGPFSVLIDGQISPQEFSIQGGVTFLREGNVNHRAVHLNEFMNLKMLRKLNFNQGLSTPVSADFTDCQYLESLSIQLDRVSGLSSQLKIKELCISSECDLSSVPTIIEKLKLGPTQVYCSSVINFPNLHYLETDNGTYLHMFVSCPNLTDLVIGREYEHSRPVQIPVKISRMSFKANGLLYFQFMVNTNYLMDYLHLELIVRGTSNQQEMYSFEKATKILEKVRPKTLIISFKDSKPLPTERDGLMNILIAIINSQSRREGTVLAVGEIKWDKDCPSLLEVVDRKAAFYLFQNGQGRAIEEDTFKRMIVHK